MTRCENYESMSRLAARILCQTVGKNPRAVIVLATGHSPLFAYRYFVEKVKTAGTDLRGVTFVKLDEWMGLEPDDPATCEYFLRTELLEPLGIREEQFLHFDPAGDGEAECARFREAYRSLPPPDLVILGIGKNGHLGLNEPADSMAMGAHVIPLAEKTRTHEMLTHTVCPVTHGITMGIGDLFRGKEILLLADGAEKREALAAYLGDEITTRCPVTLLKLHPNCTTLVNMEDFAGIL
ncbi:MAG: 6-phosphogluconolactonase [Clostridia bacterium]|nr:6-phosphogluconolactonase [Clostridia bacterium]